MIDVAILVGGKGSRLGKITKNIPKPLLRIRKIRFLDLLISNLLRYNLKRIFLLCSFKKEEFFKLYHKKKIHNSLIYCIDEGKFKGTGGALNKLKKKVKQNFILLNGDTIFNINIYQFIKQKLGSNLALIAVTKNKNYKENSKINNILLGKHGIINFSKKKSAFMNGGIYYFNKNIFKHINNKYSSLEIDIINKLIHRKKVIGKFFPDLFIDIGSKEKIYYLKKNLASFKQKAVFLDRDGVINKEVGYVTNYKHFIFLPGVKQAIKYLNDKRYLIIITSNQAAIGKLLLSEKKLIQIHLKMKRELYDYNRSVIDDIFYSPYYKYSRIKKYRLNKNDRKPSAGMIIKAINKWNIDIKKSIFIGDKFTDKLASSKCGIKFYFKENIPLIKQLKRIREIK